MNTDDLLTPSTTPDPATAMPSFTVGDEAVSRTAGRKVARVVNVNVQIRQRDRECTAMIGLHEWPLMKLSYQASGGDVTMLPQWVPGIPREKVLTEQQLKDELERLTKAYTLPREGGKRELVAEVYGATPADRPARLQATMNELHRAWEQLYAQLVRRVEARNPGFHGDCVKAFGKPESAIHPEALARYKTARLLELTGMEMTDRDLLDLVSRFDPENRGLAEIELPELGEPGEAGETPAPMMGEDAAEDSLADALAKAGFTPDQVLELQSLAGDGKVEPADLMEAPCIHGNTAKARKASRIMKAALQPVGA